MTSHHQKSSWITIKMTHSTELNSTVFLHPFLLYLKPKYLQRRQWNHIKFSLQWRHNGHDGVSNHQPHGCLLNRLFRRRSKKTSKLHVTGLCVGNSPGTGEFQAQMARNAENVSIWGRHHVEFHTCNQNRLQPSTCQSYLHGSIFCLHFTCRWLST